MDGFKKSLLALVGLLILSTAPAPPVSHGQGQPQQPRKFYLTRTGYTGDRARSACTAGYHMASLWEILDPSNLRYDTELGFVQDDSGFGPPIEFGWIRTGGTANVAPLRGFSNCNAWTSAVELDFGTVVGLGDVWAPISPTAHVISPWETNVFPCEFARRVWCMQD
jgi:hypothetical protein